MTEERMGSIVEYTDQKAPKNLYPARIISPVHSGPCCFSAMDALGPVRRDARYEYG
jgi:hypothetical protein